MNKAAGKNISTKSSVPTVGQSLFFQPKLTVNIPGDQYEQQANAMADKVMQAHPLNAAGNTFFKPAGTSLQRKCAACEEEKQVQRKESAEAVTPGVSSSVEQTLQSSGQPMEPGLRSFMEQRFSNDFSNVQIHNDAVAHRSSADINALAYTHQNHIVFGANQYQPQTQEGKKLMAHELTHVVQQQGQTVSKKIQRLNYIRQLTGDDCQPYLENFDRSLQTLETSSRTPQIPMPAEVLQAIQLLRRFRTEGRITCWETSGGLVYASYDNASGQIRLHINFSNATTTTTILHEAIHALHAAGNPEIARVYGQILSEGGTTDRNLGILMAKWKAWTEYWAYRGTSEYYNSIQTDPQFREDAHRRAMGERDVRASVARVRELTGQDFDPSQWTPPARWVAPSQYRQRR